MGCGLVPRIVYPHMQYFEESEREDLGLLRLSL